MKPLSNDRQISTNKRFQRLAKEIAAHAAKVIENDKSKTGILLCEGTKSSMDVFVYSAIYTNLVVVPVGGCSDIRKLINILVEKISLLNPFDVDLPSDKKVEFVSITIVTNGNMVQKTIDLSNVMYTFRDKAIVSQVADAMGLHGRDDYYRFLKAQLMTDKREKILFAMAKYLPVINFDDNH